MFKNIFSTILSFATGGSSTIYFIAGAFLAGSFGGWYVTSDHYEAKIVKVNQVAFEHTTKVIEQQALISQTTQKDKDELQTRYDGVIGMLRGMHNPSLSTNTNPTIVIPSQGFRLLEPDAEVLIGFARQCQNTEIERNDVINKYNALMVNK